MLMVLTKQDILRQIAQGKVRAALEGIMQLSSMVKDKELNQRGILLYSQLSQLNTKFELGTFDNKTYQLELNRITEAAISAANELPANIPAAQEYAPQAQYRAQPQPQSSGSAWKTWGILLTGAVGVVLILAVVSWMMNKPESPSSSPQNSFNNVIPAQTQERSEAEKTNIQPAGNTQPEVSKPVSLDKPNASAQKFHGTWNCILSASGIAFGMAMIVINPNSSYVTYTLNPMTNELAQSDQGNWLITENGLLRFNSALGQKEVYSVVWSSSDQFLGTLVEASNMELRGMNVTFSREN